MAEALGCKYLDYCRLGVKVFDMKEYSAAIDELKSGKISKVVFKM